MDASPSLALHLYTKHRRAPQRTGIRHYSCKPSVCLTSIIHLIQRTLAYARTSLSWRTVPWATSRNLSSCGRRPRPRQPRQGVILASWYDMDVFANPAADSCIRFVRDVLDPPWGAITLRKLQAMGVCPPSLRDWSHKSSTLTSAVLDHHVRRRGAIPSHHPTT